jgi:TonB family protein
MVPSDAPAESEREPEAEQPLRGDEVAVVRCRQVLVGYPEHARRLSALLRSGATFEEARRAIGGVDMVERQRDYALEDLEPDLRTEIEALPEGGWTRVRTWRGRSALVQLVARLQRSRSSLPVLGEGLSEAERERLSSRFRLNAAPPPPQRPQNPDETAVQHAAVLEQVKPETPADAQEGGEVVVVVEVGREGEAVDVRVRSSTNPALEEAALNAARRSRYRAATRLGIAEPGTVTLSFRFAPPGVTSEEDRGHD